MSGSNILKYWELSQGGNTGTHLIDATISTAILTGQQIGFIDVRSPAIFTTLLVSDSGAGVGVDFRIQNGLSGVTCAVGEIWPGHGRYFTQVAISTGQIGYAIKRNN